MCPSAPPKIKTEPSERKTTGLLRRDLEAIHNAALATRDKTNEGIAKQQKQECAAWRQFSTEEEKVHRNEQQDAQPRTAKQPDS